VHDRQPTTAEERRGDPGQLAPLDLLVGHQPEERPVAGAAEVGVRGTGTDLEQPSGVEDRRVGERLRAAHRADHADHARVGDDLLGELAAALRVTVVVVHGPLEPHGKALACLQLLHRQQEPTVGREGVGGPVHTGRDGQGDTGGRGGPWST
jgi:hypothetical protein